ncbi:MAG: hypothetical protein KJ645_01355, partial [Planctomycetes bacterium]|nr:hypothetical protein [Planctomycetota bacterium]
EELRQKVVKAVLSLEEPYRSAIVLKYYKDLPHKEAARRLGMSIETMRGVLKKGIARLRVRLDRSHGGSRKRWLSVMAPFAGLAAPQTAAGSSSLLAGAAVMSAKIKLGIWSLFVIGVSLISFLMFQPGDMETERVGSNQQFKGRAQADPIQSPPLQDDMVETEKEPLRGEWRNETPDLTDKDASLTITGRTLDREGLPLADVRLFLKSSPDNWLALSGSNGRFAYELSLKRGVKRRHETVILRKPGYLTRQFECALAPAEKTIHLGDIVLEPGAVLTGSVRDKNGRTVAGAEIGFSVYTLLGSAMEGIQRRRGQGVQLVQRTDATGQFRLEEVPQGWICVWARWADSLYTPSQPVEVHAGDEIGDIEIILESMAKDDFIAGRIFDPDDRPLPGAEIRAIVIEKDGSESWYSDEADEDGRFTIRLYEKIPHSLEARDPDGRYDLAHMENIEPGTHNIILKLKRFTKEVDLHVIPSGPRILEDFEVRIHSPLNGHVISKKDYIWESQFSRDGFKLPVPNVRFYLSIRANGFDTAESDVCYPEALPKRIDMLLQSLPGVQGRVSVNGIPVEGVEVGLYREIGGELIVCDFLCRSLLEAAVKTVSDHRGRFNLGFSNSGIYFLRCDYEGFAPLEIGPLELDKDVGKLGLDITLVRGGSIEGEVLMPPGRDRAGIVVAISRGDGKPMSFRTGPDGLFFFDGLTPGPWQVERREQMIMPETRQTSFGSTKTRPPVAWDCLVEDGKCTKFDLDLTGWTECRLEGNLTLEGSAPRGWTCELHDDLTKALISRDYLELDGSFSLQVDSPGRYQFRLAGCFDEKSPAVINDRVILIPGETSWSHDLSLAPLQVKGRVMNGRVYFKWTGPGDLQAYVLLPLGAQETTSNVSVPKGRGSIVHRDPSREDETVLCEVEVTEEKAHADLGTVWR